MRTVVSGSETAEPSGSDLPVVLSCELICPPGKDKLATELEESDLNLVGHERRAQVKASAELLGIKGI